MTGPANPRRPSAPTVEAETGYGYQHLRELLTQAPVAMCLLQGPKQLINLISVAAAAGWGHSVGRLQGRPFFEALPDLRGQGHEEAFATVWQTQQGVAWREAPITVSRSPGGPAVLGYFDVSFQPFHDAQGCLSGILLTSYEVTERVLARQRTRQATEELATTNAGLADYVTELIQAAHAAQQHAENQATLLTQLLEQAPLAIGLLVGADYVIEVCNAGLRTLWGCTLAQVLHQPLFEVLPEPQNQCLQELLTEVSRTGVPALAHQLPALGAPPTAPILISYYPLRDAQGHPIAIAVVATAERAPVPADPKCQPLPKFHQFATKPPTETA